MLYSRASTAGDDPFYSLAEEKNMWQAVELSG